MTKEDILENIKNGIEGLMYKSECESYINGYIKALFDCYELDSDTYYDMYYELKELYDD